MVGGHSTEVESLQTSSPRGVLMESVFCGNSLGLFWCDMCWDGIGQRGTWHETDGGYLWILVGIDLNPVASVTVLLSETETWYLYRHDSRRLDSL